MRRTLGVLAALVLALRAAPAAADPLDLDLEKLGPPSAAVWQTVAGVSADDAARLAADSRARFAILSMQLGLALSSSILAPASTTGSLGYEVDLESAFAGVDGTAVGQGAPGYAATGPWAVRSDAPSRLFMPAVHVRKALPWSVELGGRVIYLDRSQLVAAQAEAKWAVNEAWGSFPDFAVRGALTHLFGQRDLDLTTADLDLLLSRRFGLFGVLSVTPYGALRFTWVGASSDTIDFNPGVPAAGATPRDLVSTQARFPDLAMSDHLFTRYTLGVRVVTKAVSLALEGCWFPGKDVAASADFPAYRVTESWSWSAKAGLEF
jgi:hypothetical protein